MNTLPNLTSHREHLEESYKSIKGAYYVTDLSVEANIVSLYWYAKVPLLGRLISLIRFQLCRSAPIAEQLKQLAGTYQQALDQAAGAVVKGEHNPNRLIAQISACETLFNQIMDELKVKSFSAEALTSRFSFKARLVHHFNAAFTQERLKAASKELDAGRLIEAAAIQRMQFIVPLIKQINSPLPLEETERGGLAEAERLINKYGFLKQIDESLALFQCLSRPGQRLADLKQEVDQFNRKRDKITCLMHDPKCRQLAAAIDRVCSYSIFKLQYKQMVAEFDRFHKDVSVGFSDLSQDLQLKILSFVPRAELYKAADVNGKWKELVEASYARQVPQVYAKMLEDIQMQLLHLNDQWNANLQTVFSALQAMREAALKMEKLPSNLQEALGYLREQKQALIGTLSLASLQELKTIHLPCTDALIFGEAAPPRVLAHLCTCSIHSGLKTSMILSTYRQFIEQEPRAIPAQEIKAFLTFFINLVQLDIKSALKVIIHLSKRAHGNQALLDQATCLLWDFYGPRSKQSIPLLEIPESVEREAFLDIACRFCSKSTKAFADYKVERVLSKASFLKGAKNQLEELQRQVKQYLATLPANASLESLFLDPKMHQMRDVIVALNDKTFKHFYPSYAKIFDLFYKRVSLSFFTIPRHLQQKILSFIPTAELYKLGGVDEAWKGLAEHASANRVPRIYAKLLGEVREQLLRLIEEGTITDSIMAIIHLNEVCGKLKEMQEDALASKNLPTNLQEAFAYLKEQKIALTFALSLARPKELRLLKLPCTSDLIFEDDEACRFANHACRCEIHSGIAHSIIWNQYNRMMQSTNIQGFSWDFSDSFDTFFRNLINLDKQSAIKLVIHLYHYAEEIDVGSYLYQAVSILGEKYIGMSEQSIPFVDMPETADKDRFLNIVSRVFPYCTPKFAAYRIERILNKAAFLKGAENKLEALKCQVEQYMATLPPGTAPLSLLFDSHMHKLRDVVAALYDEAFEKLYPEVAKVFREFYLRVSINFTDLELNVQKKILGYMSGLDQKSAYYRLREVAKEWKASIDHLYAYRAPELYSHVLDLIKVQIQSLQTEEKTHLEAVCDQLTQIQKSLSENYQYPTTQMEVTQYWQTQLKTLSEILLALTSDELKEIKLPCLDKLNFNLEADHDHENHLYANACKCHLHKALGYTFAKIKYQQLMEIPADQLEKEQVHLNCWYSTFSNGAFKLLIETDVQAAMKMILHLSKSQFFESEMSAYFEILNRRLEKKATQEFPLASLPEGDDKDELLHLACPLFLSDHNHYNHIMDEGYIDAIKAFIGMAESIKHPAIRQRTLASLALKLYEKVFLKYLHKEAAREVLEKLNALILKIINEDLGQDDRDRVLMSLASHNDTKLEPAIKWACQIQDPKLQAMTLKLLFKSNNTNNIKTLVFLLFRYISNKEAIKHLIEHFYQLSQASNLDYADTLCLKDVIKSLNRLLS